MMSMFLGILSCLALCMLLGIWTGYQEGKERYADTMRKYYPEISDYIINESRNGYDEEELDFRGELLRARDRDRGY